MVLDSFSWVSELWIAIQLSCPLLLAAIVAPGTVGLSAFTLSGHEAGFLAGDAMTRYLFGSRWPTSAVSGADDDEHRRRERMQHEDEGQENGGH